MRAPRLIAASLLLLLLAMPAWAHTDVASSAPAEGDVVSTSLGEVVITFAEELLPGGDHAIAVFAPDGDTRIDDNTTTSPSATSVRVAVTPTEVGLHEVRWIVIAADGDEQRGDFTFELAADAIIAPEPTVASTPAETLPTDVMTTAPDVAPSSSGTGLFVAVAILAVLAVALVLIRRRSQRN